MARALALLAVRILPLLLTLAVAAGCARTAPAPTRTVKVAVLDGRLLEAITRENSRESDGWWLSQRELLRSPNDGLLATEAVGREFRKVPGVSVYAEEDLIVFLAQRDRLAYRSFPALTAADRAELLMKQSPVDYGRALGVDFVIVPTVRSTAQVQNHFTSAWSSRADLGLEFWNTLSGEKAWEFSGRDRDMFDSRLKVLEDLAEDAAREARRRNVFGIHGR